MNSRNKERNHAGSDRILKKQDEVHMRGNCGKQVRVGGGGALPRWTHLPSGYKDFLSSGFHSRATDGGRAGEKKVMATSV